MFPCCDPSCFSCISSPSFRIEVLSLYSQCLVPIRLIAVVAVKLVAPSTICHVGPIVLVEPGSALEEFLVDIQNEALFGHIHGECFPRNGEELVAHAEKAPE